MKGFSQVGIQRAVEAVSAYNMACSRANTNYLKAVQILKGTISPRRWWEIRERSVFERLDSTYVSQHGLEGAMHRELPGILTEQDVNLRNWDSSQWKEGAIRGLVAVSTTGYIGVGHELARFINKWAPENVSE